MTDQPKIPAERLREIADAKFFYRGPAEAQAMAAELLSCREERDAAQERVDLDIDEFRRIKAELDSLRVGLPPKDAADAKSLYALVAGLCDRAVAAGRQRVPLIVQRDRAMAERDAARESRRLFEDAARELGATCIGCPGCSSHDCAPESVLRAVVAQRDAARAEAAAVIKEREEYRAVVARQIEDKRRLLAERNEAHQHHENALAIAAHNIELVKQLDAENKAQFETLDALRGLQDQLLAAVMDGTAEFREWQECEADAIEGQEVEVERDHNRMLAALHTLRRKAEHVQNGTRAVVEAGSLPAHLERAEASEAEKLRAELAEARIEIQAAADTLGDWRRKAEFLQQKREQGIAAQEALDVLCKALGADVDSAEAQALMFREKAAELAAVRRQRDELLAAATMALREIRPSTECSMCHDSTWDHECDSRVNATHVALTNAIKAAAEQPAPAQQPKPEVQP